MKWGELAYAAGLIVLGAILCLVVQAVATAESAKVKCAEWSDYHDIPLGAVNPTGRDFEPKYVFWGKTCQKWDDAQ